jgi:hypothetical protein
MVGRTARWGRSEKQNFHNFTAIGATSINFFCLTGRDEVYLIMLNLSVDPMIISKVGWGISYPALQSIGGCTRQSFQDSGCG